MNKQKIVQKKQILLDEKKSPMNNFRHVFMKEELKLFSTNNKYKKDILSNMCSSAYNDNKKKKSMDLSEANTTYLSSFRNKKSLNAKLIKGLIFPSCIYLVPACIIVLKNFLFFMGFIIK